MGASLAVAALASSGLMIAVAPTAAAGVSEFQEVVSDTDPSFQKWGGDDCPLSVEGGSFYYRTFDLIVTEAGDYEYYDVGYDDGNQVPGTIDIEIGVYEAGTFDPTQPGGAGCINTIDDDGTITFPSAGTYTLVLSTDDGGDTGLGSWSLTGPGMAFLNTAPSGDPDQTPPPWFQAYSRSGPAVACEEGWKPSYAAWPNDGAGGWTCERELVYNNSSGKWDVQ